MKADPKLQIKQEPGEIPVAPSRVSLGKVSAASVASPHGAVSAVSRTGANVVRPLWNHTLLKVEAHTARRREGSGQLVLIHPSVATVMVETKKQQPVKREAPTPDSHVG